MMSKTPHALPDLISVAEVSDHLGVHAKTVQRLIKSGALPHYKIGSRTMISKQDLHAFLAMRRAL